MEDDIIIIMRHFRSFRGSRRRSIAPVIQSYKKVLNQAPVSRAAGTFTTSLAVGQDSVAAGQTSVSDSNVPTGAIIKYIEITHACGNAGTAPAFVWTAIQYILDGQSIIVPDVVGGNPRRNQVLHQTMFQIGPDQSNVRTYKFKIPKQFQRIREGMSWQFVRVFDVTTSEAVQTIYKFYR